MASNHSNIKTPQTKKSNVSKTPGAGHTDIFGNGNMLITPSKRKIEVRSEIALCFTYDDNKNKEAKEMVNRVDEIDNKNGNFEECKTEVENIQPKDEEVKVVTGRVRVPPGGFSSQLW